MKKLLLLSATVAIMAAFFLTSCQKDEFLSTPVPSGLYIRTFVRDYHLPDVEYVKSATISDTTEYLFQINSLGAKILNDNSVTVLDFKASQDKADFNLSDGSMVTAYSFPSVQYGTSKDLPFNGIIHAGNFIIVINGVDKIKMWDLETGDLVFSGHGMLLGENSLTFNMGVLLPRLDLIGASSNGIGNNFQFTWLTRTYPGYSLTAQN
jgi:hypothetical protein